MKDVLGIAYWTIKCYFYKQH